MATIQRFEDIEAWKKARELTAAIYRATSRGEFARDHDLRGQIRRASVSAMGNIAEGLERGGTREFVQFLSQAKGSSGEVRSHLYVALDAGYLDQGQFDHLYTMAADTSQLIAGLMRYLASTSYWGSKYQQGDVARDSDDPGVDVPSPDWTFDIEP